MIGTVLNVLVVEDNAADARLVELTLREVTWASFAVETVDSVVAAANRLTCGPQPDGLLLDLNLPDSSGLDTFDRIQALAPNLPIIVTTGVGDDTMALEAVRRGAQDFLIKGEAGPEMLARSLVHGVERKRAEQAIRDKEHYYQSILFNMHEDILVIDRDYRIVDVNNSVLKIAGLPREACIGRPCYEISHGLDAPCHEKGEECLLPRVFATGEAGMCAHQHRAADGGKRAVEILMSPIRGRDGAVEHVVEAVRDVSERLALEEQLAQAQKMEAIGHLAGGVAHDFNNLLMVIMGSTELALEQLPQGDPLCNHLEHVRDAGERAAGLTRQLLAFSRKQVLEPQLLEPGALVKNLSKMLRRMVGEDLEFHLTRGPDPWRVLADPGQLEQVMMNLAVNARDSMPRGGKLSIDTRNEVVAGDAPSNGEEPPPGEYVCLRVEDTGSGIPPEMVKRVFEPFFTTKERGKGTGLGLSTVFGIVKQSGGFIYLTSREGHGTIFTLYLPRVTPQPAAAQPEHGERAPRTTGTILVVEDDRNVRDLICGSLDKLGHRVIEASDGEEGLRVAREHRGRLDLVVTDVIMPGRTGDEMMEALWATSPDTRVLYISGYPDERVASHGVLRADLAYLQKPFTQSALADKVQTVLHADRSRASGAGGSPP